MRIGKCLRLGLASLLVASALTVGTVHANAQGPGGGMPPEIAAKIKKWQKWGDSHKNLTNLGDMVYQVQELNKEPDVALTKPQASKVLAIIKPWRTKTSMSEDEAKNISKQMGAVLNVKQLKKMSTIETPTAKMKKRGFGGGGPGGGGGGRPGGAGGGRPGGGFTFPDPPAKGWNPFNPDTLPFEQARPMAKQRLDSFTTDLEKRSK